jgi:hypothetical protein
LKYDPIASRIYGIPSVSDDQKNDSGYFQNFSILLKASDPNGAYTNLSFFLSVIKLKPILLSPFDELNHHCGENFYD